MNTSIADTAGGGTDDRFVTGIVVGGLTVGWVLGLGGTLLGSGSSGQHIAWVISSIGLVAATGLLTVWLARTDVLMAGGLLVFTVAEGVIHAQGPGAVDAFAAATFSYAPALLLTAVSTWPPVWARVTSAGSALAFAAHAADFLAGNTPGPESTFAGMGYGLMTITLIGWSIQLVRSRPDPSTSDA